jgi:hypothetical protein
MSAMVKWLRRSVFVVTGVALTGLAWVGYGAGDSQAALSALWSLCAPAR